MDYFKKTDVLGRIFVYCGFLLLLCVPVAISIYFNAWPKFTNVMLALLPTLAIYVPVQFIEMFTYIPILGKGGSYMAFVTGNLSNLKAPAVKTALENFEVEQGSEESEIVSVLVIGISSLVTVLILAIGVVLFLVTGLREALQSPVLAPAFDNLLAALFGCMGFVFIGKNWKIAVAPVVLMLIVFALVSIIAGAETYMKIASICVPVASLVAIGVARIMYNKGLLGEKTPKDNG